MIDFGDMDFEDKVRYVFDDYDDNLPRGQAIAKIVEVHLESKKRGVKA